MGRRRDTEAYPGRLRSDSCCKTHPCAPALEPSANDGLMVIGSFGKGKAAPRAAACTAEECVVPRHFLESSPSARLVRHVHHAELVPACCGVRGPWWRNQVRALSVAADIDPVGSPALCPALQGNSVRPPSRDVPLCRAFAPDAARRAIGRIAAFVVALVAKGSAGSSTAWRAREFLEARLLPIGRLASGVARAACISPGGVKCERGVQAALASSQRGAGQRASGLARLQSPARRHEPPSVVSKVGSCISTGAYCLPAPASGQNRIPPLRDRCSPPGGFSRGTAAASAHGSCPLCDCDRRRPCCVVLQLWAVLGGNVPHCWLALLTRLPIRDSAQLFSLDDRQAGAFIVP